MNNVNYAILVDNKMVVQGSINAILMDIKTYSLKGMYCYIETVLDLKALSYEQRFAMSIPIVDIKVEALPLDLSS